MLGLTKPLYPGVRQKTAPLRVDSADHPVWTSVDQGRGGEPFVAPESRQTGRYPRSGSPNSPTRGLVDLADRGVDSADHRSSFAKDLQKISRGLCRTSKYLEYQ